MCTVEASILDGVETLRAGGDVLTSLSATKVREQRENLGATWDAFSDTRRRFRVLLVEHCLESGVDPIEALDAWGISREIVNDLMREARGIVGADE